MNEIMKILSTSPCDDKWARNFTSNGEFVVHSAPLVEDLRFASFPKASFASDVRATPQVSTQIEQTQSVLDLHPTQLNNHSRRTLGGIRRTSYLVVCAAPGFGCV